MAHENNSDISALKMTHPTRLPSGRYFDEAFFKAESDALWSRSWQMAARLDQIPELGDWTTYEILGKSVLIVNSKSGIKAFDNACRHRGVKLASGYGNSKNKGFVCPFHGWRWNEQGESTFVYGRHLFDEQDLQADDLRLTEVRSEIWGGSLYINFDQSAPSLRDTLGSITDRFDAHHLSDLTAEWWYATEMPANWKVAMEAFMEGYHVMRTHPQLHAALGTMYNAMYGNDTGPDGPKVNPHKSIRENIYDQIKHLELLSEGMAGMVHQKEIEIARSLADIELPDDPEQAVMFWYGAFHDQITQQLRARGENVPDLNAVKVSDYVHPIEFLFPHTFLLPMFSSMSSYRIRPLTAETCLFEIWSLTHKAPSDDHVAPKEPTVLPYNSLDFPTIPQQDYANIPEQQKGLHAHGLEFIRIGREVEGLISNYQRIIDGFIDGVDHEKLKAAINQLGGNFDGPVLEFDL